MEYTEADLHVKRSLRLGSTHAEQDKVKEAMPKIKDEIDNIYGGLQYINAKANTKALTTHDHSAAGENPIKKVSNDLTTQIGDCSLKVDGKDVITDKNLGLKIANDNFRTANYRREKDGWTIQWGTGYIPGGNGAIYTATFNKEFKEVYGAHAIKIDSGTSEDTWAELNSLNTKTVSFNSNWGGFNNSNGFNIRWFAFGYSEE